MEAGRPQSTRSAKRSLQPTASSPRSDASRLRRHRPPDKPREHRGPPQLYVSLVALLDLADVTVIGNSLGGWIGAEIGLIAAPNVSGVILIDAVGIEDPEHPIADFFTLTKTQVQDLSFHCGLELGT